ncbi:MAG TPA: N-acetylmuramoyl-L-alanine amidase [Clostridium sp.]
MLNIKKKIVTFVIGFTMVFGLIPIINVQAATITSSTQSTLSKQAIAAISKLDKTKKTIVIDPGHNYGGDLGAEVTNNGVTYKEVDLNMQVASKLKVELEKRGYNVVMTRYEEEKPMIGVNQSLRDRVVIANDAKADFFISIHHNSILMAGVKGIETYYSSEEQSEDFKGGAVSNKLEISKKMAAIINDSIAKNLNLNNRGAKDASLFIRSTNMPSIIVECGFITNQEDAKRCANPLSQQKFAETIADAIKINIKSTK